MRLVTTMDRLSKCNGAELEEYFRRTNEAQKRYYPGCTVWEKETGDKLQVVQAQAFMDAESTFIRIHVIPSATFSEDEVTLDAPLPNGAYIFEPAEGIRLVRRVLHRRNGEFLEARLGMGAMSASLCDPNFDGAHGTLFRYTTEGWRVVRMYEGGERRKKMMERSEE